MFQSNILSVDPYGPTIQRTPLLQAMFGAAKNTEDLLNQSYINKQNAAKAQLAQQTLPGQVAAMNTRNQTDVTNYPLQQAALTQQDQERIKQISATTGLTNAQAAQALANTKLTNLKTQMAGDPMFQVNKIVNAWGQYPVDSPQKIILGHAIDSLTGGMGAPQSTTTGTTSDSSTSDSTSNTSSGSTNIPSYLMGGNGAAKKGKGTSTGILGLQTGTVPGAQGNLVRDQSFGPTKGGGGGTYTNLGTGVRTSTDTNANTTQDQATLGAVQRVTPLISDLMDKQSQFMTVGQKGGLFKARVSNAFGGQSQKPSDYAQAQADIAAAPESLIKAYGLRVSDDALKLMSQTIVPMWGESPQFYKQRLLNTLDHIKAMQGQAADRLSSGQVVGQQASAAMGYFASRSVSRPPVAQGMTQPSMATAPVMPSANQAPAVDMATLNAMAQNAIRKGADPAKVKERMMQLQRGGQ